MVKGSRRTSATTTVNPLHFEDLEPHRFEDVVRQLAYSFRTWRALEATGRLGADQGIDIRGIELVPAGPVVDEDEYADEERAPEPAVERIWTIQCRRYRRLPRGDAQQAVRDAVPDGAEAPYGLIVAAPTDLTTEAVLAFHQEARARGVRESHLWTRAQLEDFLFRPENDHLLFAYFGISLRVQERSQASEIRAQVALKRKLLRAFDQEDMPTAPFWKDVLIRDLADTRYPRPPKDGFEQPQPPWHRAAVMHFTTGGMIVGRWEANGWVKPDGSWDYEEASRHGIGHLGRDADAELDPEPSARSRPAGGWYDEYTKVVPQPEQCSIREIYMLPYLNIVEIDPIGDPLFHGPHLFCRFRGGSPYRDEARYAAHFAMGSRFRQLDPARRTRLFVRGLISVPYGDMEGRLRQGGRASSS